MIGSFTGMALPGLVGGDVVKAIYLCGDAVGKRSHAVASLIVDRALGFYSLFLLATIAVVVAQIGGVLPTNHPVLLTAPAILVVSTVAAGLLFGLDLGRFRLLHAIWRRLPGRLRRLAAATRVCVRHPWTTAAAVGLSVVNHALVVATFVAAGLLLRDALSPLAHFVLAPLAAALNMVGLTPGGIGVTEGFFSFIYESAGSPNGATIGLLGRLIQYLTFIAGGSLAFLLVRVGRRLETPVPRRRGPPFVRQSRTSPRNPTAATMIRRSIPRP